MSGIITLWEADGGEDLPDLVHKPGFGGWCTLVHAEERPWGILAVEDVVSDSRDRAGWGVGTADYDTDPFPKLITLRLAKVDVDHGRRCPIVNSDVPP